MTYVKCVAIAVDQLLNAILGGFPDETLSSRAYRAERNNRIFGKIFRPLIDGLLFFDRQHCYNSYLSEVERRQLPREFQQV
jgi:hypothetical protein